MSYRREQYSRGYYQPDRGPTPWVPATILGVMLLIVSTPYRATSTPTVAYHAAAHKTSFPLALLWLPVFLIMAFQIFGGNYRPYTYDRNGRPIMRTAAYGGGVAGRYGGGSGRYRDVMYGGAPGPAYNRTYMYNNNPHDKGLGSLFMDFGGHWLLILLGITLFRMVGSGSAPIANTAALPLHYPRMSLLGSLGFPFSLFAPRIPQVVYSMM